VIDHAASILTRSIAPGIRIDEVTEGLLGERFDVRADSDGRTLVRRRAEGEREAPRTLLGKPTPCVGRDKELALLELTLKECVEESFARTVLVTGPAGQGKSRLRYEFVARARERGDVSVWMARADPVGAGSAFMLVRQLVRHAVGLHEGSPVQEQHAALRAHVVARCKDPDSGRIADFLGELVGAPSSGPPSLQLRAARNDPTIMAEWLRRSFGEWLAWECGRPVLVVLEDIHWGDWPSLTYLGDALRTLTAKPLMLLALGRSEVRDAFPNLWTGVEKLEISLGRLAPRAAERLLRATLGAAVSAQVAANVVERADGNAFYLEELIRCVAEGTSNALPDTVLALVETRLERLEPEARRIVRAASVFGEVFWRNGVAMLLGTGTTEELDDWLRALVEREVFVASYDSRFRNEHEYSFRHGLLRQAAYAMLTEVDRARGHSLAGDWLDRAGEKDALTVADHFERAGQKGRALPWLLKATQAALDGGSMDAVIDLGNRGLACDPGDAERGTLKLFLGVAHAWRGAWREALETHQEAMTVQTAGSTPWFLAASGVFVAGVFLADPTVSAPVLHAILEVAVQPEPSGPYGLAIQLSCLGLTLMGQLEPAKALLERAEAMIGNSAEIDPAFVVRVQAVRANWELAAGQLSRWLESLSNGQELADRTGDAWGRAALGSYAVLAQAELGRWDGVEAAARKALAYSGVSFWNDWSRFFAATASVVTGKVTPDAIATFRALLNRVDPVLVTYARSNLAYLLVIAGDLDGAKREATGVLAETMFPSATATAHAALASVALQRGQYEDALSSADRGIQAAVSGPIVPSTLSILHLLRAEVLHASGQTDQARLAIQEARDRVHRIAATLDDPALRESYLANVDANARTLARASEWGCAA
jgi:hypothetical protein